MPNDIERLERRIEELDERLRLVENELQVGPGQEADIPVVSPTTDTPEPVGPPESKERIPATAIVSLVGRSLIIMGGAFLLRWLTQSGFLPHKFGSVVGVLYALVWIAMADFDAGRDRRASAVFYGITGSLVALPLLAEVTTKFQYLSPMLSAIHLLAFIILGLVVAGRRNLRPLAWVVTLPAAPLAFWLAAQTHAMPPFLISLLILGFATLWLGYLRGWHALATVMSGVANLGLALVVMEFVVVSNRVGSEPEAGLWEVLFLLFGLVAVYFGSSCFRVFHRKRTITPLEIGNTLVVLMVGLGGAAMAIDASENSMLPLGIVCLTLSVASYTAAYGFLPRRDPNRRNFLFYTLVALTMLLLGFEMCLDRPAASLTMTVVAAIAGLLANRIASPILYLHGATFLVVAIARSGLFAATTGGLTGESVDIHDWTRVTLILALILTLAYPWFPRPDGRASDLRLGRRANDLLLLVAVFAVSALVVSLIAQLSPQGEDGEIYRRILASARTAVLAISAALLAGYSHRTRFGNLSWLVYTILAVGAVKLVVQDIAAGGAASLFLSLALYGGALVLAPRLLHSAAKRQLL